MYYTKILLVCVYVHQSSDEPHQLVMITIKALPQKVMLKLKGMLLIASQQEVTRINCCKSVYHISEVLIPISDPSSDSRADQL